MDNENYLFGFEKLDVWNEVIDVMVEVYRLLSKFPDVERYNLVSQSSRAVISISLNIAEGSGKLSPKDQNRLYRYAYTSSLEVVSCMTASYKLKYINEDESYAIRKRIHSITNKINKMHRKNLEKIKREEGKK